jgi:hypothetical protein
VPVVYLFTGHIIRNMEGGASLRKRVIVSTIQCLLLIGSYGMWDYQTTVAGRWNWDCDSLTIGSLQVVWVLFNVFCLGFVAPLLAMYYLAKDLRDGEGSKSWKFVSLLFLSGTVYYYFMTQYPGIVTLFYLAKSDSEKLLYRLFVVPMLGYVGFFTVNWASKKLKLHDTSDSVYTTMIFLLVSAFFSRFLQNSFSTYSATITCNVLVGVQEMLMRFTLKARGRVFAKYILRKPEAELAALEGESGVSDEDKRRRGYTARLILAEMVIEYVAIFLAPLLTVFYQKNSVDVQLGYELDGSYDAGLLAFSAVTSLLLEVVVDTICFRVQEKWFKLREEWRLLTLSGKLWSRLFPNVVLGTLTASIFMLSGFMRMQQHFASNKCAFVDHCLPDPCLCYSATSPTVTVPSHLTGKNVSLSLPPLFARLCHDLDQVNNGTSPAMTEEAFKRMYSKILTP